MKAKKNDRWYFYYALLILTGMITLFPVGYNCIMSGGMVTEWVVRVDELASGLREGKLYLFPTAEALAGTGEEPAEKIAMEARSVNSNFWFLLPGVLFCLWGNIVHIYDVSMLALQAGTLLTSLLLFQRIFADRETRLPVFFGVLLYMTSPYRIYVCYDLADISQATAWMLFPLYAWAVAGVMTAERKRLAVFTASLALAGIGYADAVFFLFAAGAAVLAGLIRRRFWCLVPAAAGGVLFLPGLYRFVSLVFLDGFPEWDVSMQALLPEGYRLGEYFLSFFFRSGHPGMGLGMLICLLTGIWLVFVENKRENHGKCKAAVILSICFAVLSLYGFPWELSWKTGNWSWKILALAGGPAMFWGMACMCLCVPAACAMDRISRHENKSAAFVIPLAAAAACMGVCVYQCNMLGYGRMPL